MKKQSVFAALLALLLLLSACAPAVPAESTNDSLTLGTPAPTPVPTPTPPPPEGMEKVFGKEITVALLAHEGEEFAAGALHEAERLGIPLIEVQSAEAANTADLCIGYDLTAEEVKAITVPLSLYTTDNRLTADALLYYDEAQNQGLAEAAWDALFHYPSHESPIRLMTLLDFESIPEPIEEEAEEAAEEKREAEAEGPIEEVEVPELEEEAEPDPYPGYSAGARIYETWKAEGKLLSRGMYHGQLDGATDWLTEALEDYIPGTVDTIYAETPELALAGYEVLVAANRSDAVEIIAAGLNWDILAAMIENHFLFGAAVGPDHASAGALALRRGLNVLLGERAPAMLLAPTTILSEDVYALVREGYVAPAAIAIALNETLAAEAEREEWTYLQEYYAE